MANSPVPLSVKQLDAAIELMAAGRRKLTLPMCGDSMFPTLRSGERIAVDLQPERVERGDMVLFRQVDYLVVHRLLGTASREDGAPWLRTRGDGRLALDPPLARSRLRGRVVAAEIDGRWCGFDGAAARVYAIALAVHGLVWSAAGAIARAADRRLGRFGLKTEALVDVSERSLLHAVHRLLFHRLHAEVPPPEDAVDAERLLY